MTVLINIAQCTVYIHNNQLMDNVYAVLLELTSLVGFFGDTANGVLTTFSPCSSRSSFSRNSVTSSLVLSAFCTS